MTLKGLSIWIGSAIAALGLFAVLTAVPAAREPEVSVEKTVLSSAPDTANPCVDIEFRATFHYTVAKPLVDLWGLRTVDDVTITPARITVSVNDTCGSVPTGVGGTAYVWNPACTEGMDPQALQMVADGGSASSCDDRMLYYGASVQGGLTTSLMNFDGAQPIVGGSGLGRGEWCLGYYSDARYSSGNAGISAGAETTSGDLCLDPS